MRSIIILITSSLLLLAACSKKDISTYYPVNPTDSSGIPPLFTDPKLQMVSDFEKGRGTSLQGHTLLKSLQGGNPLETGFELFGILSKAISKKQDAAEMNRINKELNSLLQQNDILINEISSLSEEMNYNTSEIIQKINNLQANSYITDIMVWTGTGDQLGLGWFSQALTNWGNNLPGYDSAYIYGYVGPAAQSFVNFHKQSPVLNNDIKGINGLICPPLIGDTSCLTTFTQLLIRQFVEKTQGTSNSVMNTYLFLEYYFMTLLNYQLQAATVKMNVLEAYDTTMAKGYWSGTIIPYVQQEVAIFLKSTDYLLINMDEYRTQDRWNSDMNYSGLYMAPNSFMTNTLARAQFQAKVLLQAVNAPVSDVYGSIFTSQNYCTSPPNVNIGGASFSPPAVTNVMKSRIPYTKWTTTNCSPDNNWTSYHYATGNGLNCQPWNINVIPTWPRSSSGNGYGTITPLWYNPRDPTQSSIVQTDSCYVKFAFFGLIWQWGVFLTDLANASNMNLNLNLAMGDVGAYNCIFCGSDGNGGYTTAPFVGQYHTNVKKYENIQHDMVRTYGKNAYGQTTPFKYSFQCSVQPYSSGVVVVKDLIGIPINVGSSSSLQGGGTALWMNYSASQSFSPQPNLTKAYLYLGSYYYSDDCTQTYCGSSAPLSYASKHDILWNISFTSAQTGYYNFSIPSGPLSPNFGYIFEINDSKNATWTTMQVTMLGQVVYNGYAGF